MIAKIPRLCRALRVVALVMAVVMSPAGLATTPSSAFFTRTDPVLDALLADAQQGSPSVELAQARLDEAAALSRRAAADRRPEVALQGSASRRRFGALEAVDPNADRYQTIVDGAGVLTWPLDVFGTRRREAAAQDDERRATAEEARQARLRLQEETVATYLALLSGDQLQALDQQRYALLSEQVRILSSKQASGLISPATTASASADLAELSQRLKRGELQRDQALARLQSLVGPSAASLALLGRSAAPGRASVPRCGPLVPTSIDVQRLANRPDVRAAEFRWQSAQKRVEVARRLRWPSLELSGRGGFSSPAGGSLLASENLAGQLLISLGLPLIDGGRRRADVDAAEAREDQAEASLAEIILSAGQEVDQGLAALHESAWSEQAATSAERSRIVSARGERSRFENGLSSREQLNAARLRAIDARASRVLEQQRTCELLVRLKSAAPEGEGALFDGGSLKQDAP